MKNSVFQKWWAQMSFWLLFVGMVNYMMMGELPLLASVFEFLAQAILPIFLFYLCYAIYVPRYFGKGEHAKFVVVWLTSLLVLTLINSPVAYYFILYGTCDDNMQNREFLINSPYRIVLMVGVNMFLISFIAVVSRIIFEQYNEREQFLEREREHFKNELLLLKSQINPHFLLNTLNNLYTLTEIDTTKTQTAILQLADLLRYVLYDSKQEKVLLLEEMKVMQAYIALHQIKYEKPLNIKLNFAINDRNDILIEPMLLVPILENAFKHSGIGTIDTAFITINIEIDKNKQLFIRFENSISAVSTAVIDEHSGIGLANVARRLAILYPNKEVEFWYQTKYDVFETVLIFDLKDVRLVLKDIRF